MNLSAWEIGGQPAAGDGSGVAGLAIARRRRLAGWAGALAGNWAEGAFEVGEWDAILALAADLDAEGLLPVDESANIFVGVYLVRAYRGAVDEATAALERVLGPADGRLSRSAARLPRRVRPPALRRGRRRGDAAARGGAPRLAARCTRTTPSRLPGHRSGCATPPACARCWASATSPRVRATDLRFAAIRAGLAALEGRPDDARAAYLAAESGLRELGIRFELGLALLEHAVFLAGDASARAADRGGAGDLRGAGGDHPARAAAGRGSLRHARRLTRLGGG